MLTSFADQFRLPIRLTGRVASRVIDAGGHGRIMALFESSFYIETDNGLVCVGNQDLSPCPLNLVSAAPRGTNWSASGMRLDQVVNISTDSIIVGNRFSFPRSDTSNWIPPGPPRMRIDSLRRGLQKFREAGNNYRRADDPGLYRVQDYHLGQSHDVCKAASAPIAVLREWLSISLRNPGNYIELDLEAVKPLLGLGPGLTPSGDDFVGGIMIALNMVGESGICLQLWESIAPAAGKASNPISFAHLQAASSEGGNEKIHSSLIAILQGDAAAIQDCLHGIQQIGHTSGWDIMAGAVIVLESIVEARSE